MNNENGKVHKTIDSVFHVANNDLFDGYKLTYVSSVDGAANHNEIDGDGIMSVLSASGEGVKILSSIKMSVKTAAFIHPNSSPTIAMADLQDLCGELNNQLVGKVKNKMLAYDCRLMLGLPTFVTGKDIVSSSSPSASVTERVYKSDAGDVIVCLHTVIHPEFSMLDEPNEELTGAVQEGTLSFF